MWFDWTRGGELIDSERLGVEAQQVCVGWRGPSRHFVRCRIPLIYSLTLFECEKWRGGDGRCQELSGKPLSPPSVSGGRERRGEKREGGGQTSAVLSGFISQPLFDLKWTVLSLLPHPPKASSHPFMLISPLSLPPFSSSHLPLFSCWGNAIWQGLSLCKLGWGSDQNSL